ncbi:hypothetical protein ACSTHB_23625, partial [Vibrio parahaemolyticus]
MAEHFGFKTGVPWQSLSETARAIVLYGSGKQAIRFAYDDGLRKYTVNK